MHQVETCLGCPFARHQECGRVALPGQLFPFFQRWISPWHGLLPFAYAFRPADFGSLITWISYGVVSNGVEPTFLLRKAEKVLINPIFQAQMKRLGLGCFGCQSLSRC